MESRSGLSTQVKLLVDTSQAVMVVIQLASLLATLVSELQEKQLNIILATKLKKSELLLVKMRGHVDSPMLNSIPMKQLRQHSIH